MAPLAFIATAVLLSSLALGQLLPSTHDPTVGNFTIQVDDAIVNGSMMAPQRPDWVTWATQNIPQGVDRQCIMRQTGGSPRRCQNSKDCDFFVYSRNYTTNAEKGGKGECAINFHHYLWRGKLLFHHL